MSDDGADLGMDANSALKVVLGGEEEKRTRTIAEMGEVIRATTTDPHTYDGTANYCANLILHWLLEDPTRAQGPTENVYRLDDEGHNIYERPYAAVGWYDQMKEDGIPLNELDLTGLMWGWAVNAARTIVELPAVPNPAILTIG